MSKNAKNWIGLHLKLVDCKFNSRLVIIELSKHDFMLCLLLLLNIVCKHDQDHVYVVLTVIHETIVITNIEKSSLFCKSICRSNFQQIFIKIPSRSLKVSKSLSKQ